MKGQNDKSVFQLDGIPPHILLVLLVFLKLNNSILTPPPQASGLGQITLLPPPPLWARVGECGLDAFDSGQSKMLSFGEQGKHSSSVEVREFLSR
jgi:hypothetical protein